MVGMDQWVANNSVIKAGSGDADSRVFSGNRMFSSYSDLSLLLPGIMEGSGNTITQDGLVTTAAEIASSNSSTGGNSDRRVFNLNIKGLFGDPGGLFQKLGTEKSKEYISNCGVFPVCDLEIYADDETLKSALQGFTFVFEEKWEHFPESLKGSARVVCSPSKVSGVIVLNIIIIILSICSNLVICFVTLRSKSLRKPHGYFKLSLAISDILTGIVILPVMSSNMINRIEYDGEKDLQQILQATTDINYSQATVFGVLGVLSKIVTLYSILLLSVDSFLSIRWPLRYSIGDLMSVKKSFILIGLTWVFAAVVASLPIMSEKYAEYKLSYPTMNYIPELQPLTSNGTAVESIHRFSHGIVYIAVVWGLPFVVTWIMTLGTAIYSKLMLSRMENFAPGQNRVCRKTISDLNKDILKTVVVVLSLFTITVTPITVSFILQLVRAKSNPICQEKQVTLFFFVSFYILLCGSFVNVIVYNVFNLEFRKETKKTFKSLAKLCCRGMSGSPHMGNTSTMSKSTRTKMSSFFFASSQTKKSKKSETSNQISSENNRVIMYTGSHSQGSNIKDVGVVG